MSDYLLIGGGVIGLLLARELSAAGATITIVEKGECCKEASWAGGGIVSPLYPWRYKPEITALSSWAQDYYPHLVEQLQQETGVDAELFQTGLLMLDSDEEAQALRWAKENNRPMEKVNAGFLYDREENLGKNFSSALWMPYIANIRNPRLGEALRNSLQQKSNVSILENSDVVNFIDNKGKSGNCISGVEVARKGSREQLFADEIVVCAGAWSGSILGLLNIDLPIEPVKGQMLLYKADRTLINSILLTKGKYLIPRRDNHILVGSTLEYTKFDKTTSHEGLVSLQKSAFELMPELKKMKLKSQWAGLRPGAPDGIPFIGKIQEFENLYINAGHFRNGLVLAPASARLMADILLGRDPIVDAGAYEFNSKKDSIEKLQGDIN